MLLLLSSCYLSTPCQEPCRKLYSDSECGIQRAGRTQDELVENCLDECQEAYSQSGDVGDYDPFMLTDSSVSVSLDNRAQQELWAECIAETSCDRINDGYCAPVW